MSKTAETLEAERISMLIRPLLAGHPPQVQGAVLADLLSLFIAGHHPELRDQILALHFDAVRDLVPHSEAELFPNGRPPQWPRG